MNTSYLIIGHGDPLITYFDTNRRAHCGSLGSPDYEGAFSSANIEDYILWG